PRRTSQQPGVDLGLMFVPIDPLLGRHLPVHLVAHEVLDADQARLRAGAVKDQALVDVVVEGLAIMVSDPGVSGWISPKVSTGEGQRIVTLLGSGGLGPDSLRDWSTRGLICLRPR